MSMHLVNSGNLLGYSAIKNKKVLLLIYQKLKMMSQANQI